MPSGPGPLELLLLIPIALWNIGLPIALAYLLYRVWQRLGAVESELQQVKKLVAVIVISIVVIGALLAQPSFSVQAQTTDCPTTPYIVQRGDRLALIARKCDVALRALIAANPQIVNINRIEIGDRITIPGRTTSVVNIEQALNNATYSLDASGTGGYIRLRNGVAYQQTDIGEMTVQLLGPTAQGDMNGDDATDAVTVLMRQTANTTGRFYTMYAMASIRGTLVEADAIYLGDRIGVNSIQIQPDGAVVLDAVLQGANDPLAGASNHVIRTYRLHNGKLVLIQEIPVNGNTSPLTGQVCADALATQLQVGGRAYVLYDNPGAKYVRSQSGNAGPIIGEMPRGTAMFIADGPRCGDSRTWWYVQADNGLVGWTSEGSPVRYFIAPVGVTPPSPEPCATAPTPRLTVGGRAFLIDNVRNILRNGAQTTAQDIGRIQVREGMDVLAGPQCDAAAGWYYWLVRTDRGITGWTAEGEASTYWLAPQSSQLPPLINIADFRGTWQTNFARMTLEQSGSSISGSYIRYSRTEPTTMSGTVAGRTFSGVNERGTAFALTMSPNGNSFDGTWRGRDGRQYEWCGVRSGPLPAGCGFSSTWQTNHRTGGWVQLTQTGENVTGRYYNGFTQGTLNGQFELLGTTQVYSLSGSYRADGNTANDYGTFRFQFINLDGSQFQGCWRNSVTTRVGSWCGWPGATGTCPQVTVCQ